MIIIRNVFQLKFGKAREAVELWRKGEALIQKETKTKVRLLTDVTGQFYTLVLEMESKSLTDYERAQNATFGSAAWRAWYKKFSTLVKSGHREIFHVVD